MGASVHFSLVLFLLLFFSSPARAQWLSLFWATPKVSTTSPPLSPAVAVTATATATTTSASSAVSPAGWPTTESAAAADGYRGDRAHGEASVPPSPAAEDPSTPPVEGAGGVGRSRPQRKLLRQWKSGEETLLFFSFSLSSLDVPVRLLESTYAGELMITLEI